MIEVTTKNNTVSLYGHTCHEVCSKVSAVTNMVIITLCETLGEELSDTTLESGRLNLHLDEVKTESGRDIINGYLAYLKAVSEEHPDSVRFVDK